MAVSEHQRRLGDKTSAQTMVGGKIRKDSLELSFVARALESPLPQGVNQNQADLKSACPMAQSLAGEYQCLGLIAG